MRFFFDTIESDRLDLSGVDEKIYFFIKSFGKDGINIGTKKLAESFIKVGEKTVKRGLDRLIGRGLIIKEKSDYIINGGMVNHYYAPQVKMTEGDGSKRPTGKVKMTEGTPYNNTNNIQTDNTNNIQRGSDPEIITISEVVLIEWNNHYKRHFNTGYVPDYRSLTNDKNLIVDAVKAKMKDFQKNPNDIPAVEEFVRAMFEAMFSVADKWQKENWTLHTVASQFNPLYNAIINRKNGNNSNNNGGISADYLERKMREAAGIV